MNFGLVKRLTPGGWPDGISPGFVELGADPTTGAGFDCPIGSIAKLGAVYYEKTTSGANGWTQLVPRGRIPAITIHKPEIAVSEATGLRSAGNNTVGWRFLPRRDHVCTGVRAWLAADGNPRTFRLSIWRQGDGSRLAYADVTVPANANGIYSGTFPSIVLSSAAGTTYNATMWPTDSSAFCYFTWNTYVTTIGTFFGPYIQSKADAYVGGDACPTTEVVDFTTKTFYPVEPILADVQP